jgi:isoquinoline 1-oxidoreductase subunit beta
MDTHKSEDLADSLVCSSATEGITRRSFVALAGFSGLAIVVDFSNTSMVKENNRLRGLLGSHEALASEPNASGTLNQADLTNPWLRISVDNTITFVLDRVEMGQGTMTSHAMIISEELRVDPSKIKVVFANGEGGPYKNPKLGIQLTGGSTSVATSFEPLRKAGAQAREMLRQAAANRWGISLAQVEAVNGELVDKTSGQKVSYGEVAAQASLLSVPKVNLDRNGAFTQIGKSIPRLDLKSKIRGEAVYGIDVQIPNLLHCAIVRAPVARGIPVTVSSDEAKKSSGVEAVETLPYGVAVVANTYYRAKQAANKIKVTWELGDLEKLDSAKINSLLAEGLQQDGKKGRSDGDFKELWARSTPEQKKEFTYQAPFLAHATLEPQTATAFVEDNKCTIWAPTQGPDLARKLAHKVTGMDESKITVIQTYLGGGFGRRIEQDYVEDAVRVSMAIKRPVKVIWSREDDIRHDFYRPAAMAVIKGILDEKGVLKGVFAKVATPSLLAEVVPKFVPTVLPDWMPNFISSAGAGIAKSIMGGLLADPTGIEGLVPEYYNLTSARTEHVNTKIGPPIGFWRAVGFSFNVFFMESFLDEIAVDTKKDPFELRKDLLKNSPRHLRVLELAAAKSNWAEQPPPGVFRGLALAESFETIVAQVAEVEFKNQSFRVLRVVSAVDCGIVINPDIARAQIEGGVVFALSAALKEEITFKAGQVEQSNFHDFEVLRANECPLLEVHFVESKELPTGLGEPGVPAVAPALGNALFRATGVRRRSLPFRI